MKKAFAGVVLCLAAAVAVYAARDAGRPLVGAFIADAPDVDAIDAFRRDYGAALSLVMVFVDWGSYVAPEAIDAVYGQGGALIITWEPWSFADKQGVDLGLIAGGGYDGYIREFARRLSRIDGMVYLRFAHEMNGDWYPWSSARVGAGTYVAAYRHVKDLFDGERVTNVRWVFAVNWEDLPRDNHYADSYPGDGYVDYVGIDGYNWGTAKPWSRWMAFDEIFAKRYAELTRAYGKPLMISEFGCSGSGGDKRSWVAAAFASMRSLKGLAGFVLFNVDKETDWRFDPSSEAGQELKRQLSEGV